MSIAPDQALEGNIQKFNLRRTKNNGKTIHCFFEGKDDKFFYLDFVQAIFKEYSIFYYTCETKSYVYKTRDKLEVDQRRRGKYSMNQLLFFTDADYDRFIGKEWPIFDNLFVTKWYSIENYIATPNIFKRCLAKFFNNIEEDEIPNHHKNFTEAYEAFSKSIPLRTISALAIFDRSNKEYLALDKIKFDTFFEINPPNVIEKSHKHQQEIQEEIQRGELKKIDANKRYFKDDIITYCIWKCLIENKTKVTSSSKYDRPIYDLLLAIDNTLDESTFLQLSISKIASRLESNGKNKIEIADQVLSFLIRKDNFTDERSKITAYAEELNSELPKNYIRGKFIIWFFRAYYNSFRPKQSGKSIEITPNNEVKLLSLLILKPDGIPDDIREFLDNNQALLNNYFNENT